MIQQNISLFSLTVRIAKSLGSILVQWNSQTQKLHLVPNYSGCHKALNRKLFLHASLLFLMTFQGILTLPPFNHTKSYNFTDKFVYGFGLLYIFSSHFQLQVCRRQAKAICLYVNGILQFQNKYRSNGLFATMITRKPSLIERMNVCFAYAFCSSVISLPVAFIYGLHWTNPCKPSIIGYQLISECHEPGNTNKWIRSLSWKLLVFAINHWTWSFTLNVSLFVVSGIQVLCTLSLRGFIET